MNIFKHIVYQIKHSNKNGKGTIELSITPGEHNPSMTFIIDREAIVHAEADGKYCVFIEGDMIYRMLDSIQDALKEFKKHE